MPLFRKQVSEAFQTSLPELKNLELYDEKWKKAEVVALFEGRKKHNLPSLETFCYWGEGWEEDFGNRFNTDSALQIIYCLGAHAKKLVFCEIGRDIPLEIQDRVIKGIADHCPNLEELDLEGCQIETGEFLSELLQKCKLLRKLGLGAFGTDHYRIEEGELVRRPITHDELATFHTHLLSCLPYLKNLEEIDLSGRQISADMLVKMKINHPNLEITLSK